MYELNDAVGLICNAGPITAGYAATTGSGVALTDPYAVQRGANKGSVHLMSQGGRSVLRFVVPRRLIRVTVRVRLDSGAPEWVDLVFTKDAVTVVHTSIANAGIFTISNVYRLPYGAGGKVDARLVADDAGVRQMVALGLSFYQPATNRCGPPPRH